jgi:hypothetical protein
MISESAVMEKMKMDLRVRQDFLVGAYCLSTMFLLWGLRVERGGGEDSVCVCMCACVSEFVNANAYPGLCTL